MTQPAHRTGLIARKVGMTQVFREDGRRVSATLLHVDDCRVVGLRKPDKDGYTAVCLGAGSRKEKRIAKPQRVEYAKKDLAPAATVTEFRVKTEEALPPIGAALSPQHFAVGQFVDIAGVTKGRGFAGSMKRHGFGGGRASHGTSVAHRAHGSTGQHQDPGRVFKNKKMAGHMGARRRTALNLEVLATDPEAGILVVSGSVPGADQTWVLVRDAVKREAPKDLPFPAALVGDSASAGGDEPQEAPEAPVEASEATVEAPEGAVEASEAIGAPEASGGAVEASEASGAPEAPAQEESAQKATTGANEATTEADQAEAKTEGTAEAKAEAEAAPTGEDSVGDTAGDTAGDEASEGKDEKKEGGEK